MNEPEYYVGLVLQTLRYGFQQAVLIGGPLIKSAVNSNPDLTSILLLLIILYISLMILNHVTRMMYSLILTAVKLVVLAIIITAVFWVSARGVQGVYEDAVQIFGQLDSTTVQSGMQVLARKGMAKIITAQF
jgi:hypothetical protein